MMRASAFRQVGGFNPKLIAGEEPELCLRLRRENWRILRLDAEMTLHDAAILRFGQWWRRTLRCGCGYAAGATLQAGSKERHYLRQTASALAWGGIAPATAFAAAAGSLWFAPLLGLTAAVLAAYCLLLVRIYRRRRRRADSPRLALYYSLFCVDRIQGRRG